MPRQAYDTDLTDAEWELFEKTLLDIRTSTKGRKPVTARREMVNAILYRLRTGCQWRSLPHDFPRWDRVYRTYRRWIVSGYWERIHDALCREVRKKTAAIRSLRLSS
jgi:transposase